MTSARRGVSTTKKLPERATSQSTKASKITIRSFFMVQHNLTWAAWFHDGTVRERLSESRSVLYQVIQIRHARILKNHPQIMTIHTVASRSADFKGKVESRQARVAIIGMGYVGLPLALLYSEQKFRVTGFDIDQKKVDTLNTGGSYIFRITPEEIQTARTSGLKATSNYAQLAEMDAIIICVPTPLNEYHEPDLSYITNT
jgi:threonine dehydrogenase-like Zn-dependent dehydrogenase